MSSLRINWRMSKRGSDFVIPRIVPCLRNNGHSIRQLSNALLVIDNKIVQRKRAVCLTYGCDVTVVWLKLKFPLPRDRKKKPTFRGVEPQVSIFLVFWVHFEILPRFGGHLGRRLMFARNPAYYCRNRQRARVFRIFKCNCVKRLTL